MKKLLTPKGYKLEEGKNERGDAYVKVTDLSTETFGVHHPEKGAARADTQRAIDRLIERMGQNDARNKRRVEIRDGIVRKLMERDGIEEPEALERWRAIRDAGIHDLAKRAGIDRETALRRWYGEEDKKVPWPSS